MGYDTRHTWAIVLAGGQGTRLESVTRDAMGVSIPKQYCTFGMGKSLLHRTLERAARLVGQDRVITVVAKEHHRWWTVELADQAPENIIVQPENRGTAAGILLPLLEILRRDSHATVLVFPSDHGVEDEVKLLETFEQAAFVARRNDGDTVLLGMTPEHPETGYGWIVRGNEAGERTHRVGRFVEKPEAKLAKELFDEGALWSSFLFAGTTAALTGLYRRALPWMLGTFLASFDAASALDTPGKEQRMEAYYRTLHPCDFSRDVLERNSHTLRVATVPHCGWSDLGTPERLAAFLNGRFGRRQHTGGISVAVVNHGRAIPALSLQVVVSGTQS